MGDAAASPQLRFAIAIAATSFAPLAWNTAAQLESQGQWLTWLAGDAAGASYALAAVTILAARLR